MKEIIKQGIKLFGRTILINIMCFFLVISMVSIIVAVSNESTGLGGFGFIVQIMNLIMVVSLTYAPFWDRGYKDRNMVLTGNQKATPLKGAKVGLIAVIPYVISVPIFSMVKNFPSALFKLINSAYYPLFDALTQNTDKFCDLAVWKYIVIALVFLVYPLVSGLSYYAGYKDFSLAEKITYKKTK